MTSSDAPAEALASIESAFDNAQLDAAAQQIAALEKLHADSIPLQVARARLTAARGDASGAIRSLNALVKHHPGDGLPRAYLGALLASQGAFGDAVDHLQRAITQGGDVPAAQQG